MATRLMEKPDRLKNGKHKTVEADKAVVVKELDVRHMSVTLEGTSPLIVHAWSAKAIKMIEDKQQKKSKVGREAKNPEQEFQDSLYRDEDGKFCIPARAIKAAIVTASTAMDDIKSYSKTRLKQGIFILGDLLRIRGAEPRMRTDMVRLGGPGGTADVRYRGEFETWEVDVAIDFNANLFSPEQVVQMLENAGFGVGLCEWRPEKNGNFGRFRVKRAK